MTASVIANIFMESSWWNFYIQNQSIVTVLWVKNEMYICLYTVICNEILTYENYFSYRSLSLLYTHIYIYMRERGRVVYTHSNSYVYAAYILVRFISNFIVVIDDMNSVTNSVNLFCVNSFSSTSKYFLQLFLL